MSPKLLYDNDSMPLIPKLAFVKSPNFGQMGGINSVQRVNGEVYINEDQNQTIENLDPSLDQKLAYDLMQRRRSLQKTRNHLLVHNDFSHLYQTNQSAGDSTHIEVIPEVIKKKHHRAGGASRIKKATKSQNKTADQSVSTLVEKSRIIQPQTLIDDLMERYGRVTSNHSATKFVKIRKSGIVDKRRKSLDQCGNCGEDVKE